MFSQKQKRLIQIPKKFCDFYFVDYIYEQLVIIEKHAGTFAYQWNNLLSK